MPSQPAEWTLRSGDYTAAVTAFRYPDSILLGVGHSDGRRRTHVANPDVVQDSRLVLATAEGETLGSAEGAEFVGLLLSFSAFAVASSAARSPC